MTRKSAIAGARIFDGERFHDQSALVFSDGKIEAIVPEASLGEAHDVERLNGGVLAPGFIDAQVNGGGGRMLNDQPTPETMFTIAKGHRKYGTTSLLPTLITDTTPVRDRAIEAAIEAVKADKGVAGLHLEGPHLAPARKGAHLAELMRPVNDADIALYIHTAKQIGTLLVTLAAEQVTPDQVRRLSDGGVVVSIGHSDTTADEAFKRFDAGARSVTHLFNAMSQIGHRAPGLAGAALDHPDIWCGIVADGHHVDPMALRLALRAKRGDAHLFFVTDAMALVGSASESFEINGRAVRRVPGGICSKLVLADGTIAGSDLDMASAVRFGVAELELTLAEALRMASHYPARYLHLNDRGTFRPGMRMDAVHLDDGLFAKATWLSGEKQISG
ncbi:N-acetylglucosamine-6-phosphate deacetylase [Brucella anthropi]|uniref:N-acetylglucosamine-6-phosphate deacetylase n=1 Tax=Brucella anthropi TaxID=529 RepID=UPI00124E9FF7|nr:N-acetylglucosamine-6-phosphate deacetylase [Brucella anthropi]KAB2752404.1 N-acetylglucosamine-6-phosphate deacetylase [Brucella anthropi]MDH0368307.1 N-acetylglucosamine-6-phosphate deacetylase [Brucella anthropi]